MQREFQQVEWDAATADQCRQLVRLAVQEDLQNGFDWTTVSLVDEQRRGQAALVARDSGVLCGMQAAQIVIDETDADLRLQEALSDGQPVEAGQQLAVIEGSARDLLTTERITLNFLGRLSGVATLAQRYAAAVQGTSARIFDTRKTTPGWRRLEKFAVRCGGGSNHRTGLYDAILIKDNHLALGTDPDAGKAVLRAREFVKNFRADEAESLILEIEVDTLEQLREVLVTEPDIVLLDNMSPDLLREAVTIRDQKAPETTLEASGGINLGTVRAVAETGVDRISVGALTHSAVNFDIGLDWSL